MIECQFNELKTNEIGEGLVILNDLNFIENLIIWDVKKKIF